MAYASCTELGYSIPAAAVARVSAQQQQWHLDVATGIAESYLRSRYSVPLADPIPREVVSAVVSIAGFDLLCSIGFNPQEYDNVYQLKRDAALEWLKAIGAGSASLSSLDDATPSVSEGGCVITTETLRGW